MGRKKVNKGECLGRSIIKDRFGNKKHRHPDSHLHTSELEDGLDWNKINLRSVTEENTLDEFLATAEMAGTDFTAERLNIKIVNPDIAGLISVEEELIVKKTQEANRAFLQIPRRPAWDENTTPQQLDEQERITFLEWRRQLAELQEVDGIILTPYERNLDFWRQLWRVLERSDVVVQIVDARNPLLFRCPDLEKYVKEINKSKVNVILVNKADHLSDAQREAWTSYYDGEGVRAIFWSAFLEAERLKQLAKDEGIEEEDTEQSEEDSDYEEEEMESTDSEDDVADDNSDNIVSDQSEGIDDHTDNVVSDQSESRLSSSDQSQLTNMEHANEPVNVNQSQPVDSQCVDMSDTAMPELPHKDTDSNKRKCVTFCEVDSKASEACKRTAPRVDMDSDCADESSDPSCLKNSSDVLGGEELLDLLKSLHTGKKFQEGVTTIGLVGYPNVGKSSTINALLQVKKVPVSATPGRTKHFQTLHVESDLILCDCPGLVMPTFVTTKAEMVVCGILPIDHMRDFVPPVTLVCRRMPRPVLQGTYGILLPKPREGEDPERPPTAHELLASYSYMRGYMTHKGVCDYQRSARYILKDYVNGKLLFGHPPPGVTTEEFESVTMTSHPHKERHDQEMVTHTKGHKKIDGHGDMDNNFFHKPAQTVGMKGFHGPTSQAEHRSSARSVSESSSVAGSTEFLAAAKSWKKHNNLGKKQKLRRIHGLMDA